MRAGIAQNAVSRIERGDVDAGFSTVRTLIRACGFEPEISLATRDSSYARDVRRLRGLTPRERLDHAVHLAYVAQSTRRAAASTTSRMRHSERGAPRRVAGLALRPARRLARARRPRRRVRPDRGRCRRPPGLAASHVRHRHRARAGSAQPRRACGTRSPISTRRRSPSRRRQSESDVSFYTPFGHVDVHRRPAGFASYAELRRGSEPIQLEPDLAVLASSLRDIVRSRLAAGDNRQLPALEAALELERAS